MVFSDAALNSIVLARPTTVPALLQVSGVGPRIADTHGASIIALCRSEAPSAAVTPSFSPKSSGRRETERQTSSRPQRSAVERPLYFSQSVTNEAPAETFTRLRATTPDPTDDLTPEQQTLDQRLRDWRKAESEKLGVPLFFVLASTTLRSIVLTQPQTLAQLKSIHGLGLEKAEKFGPGIIEVCTT